MPSSRRLKLTGLALFLTVCVLFYVTNGASSTHNSDFYVRTVAAIQKKQQHGRSREDILEEERQRHQRLQRIQEEHQAAISATTDDAKGKKNAPADAWAANQQPMIPNGVYGENKVADIKAGETKTRGRKYMKDGKVVTYKPNDDHENDNDGVAKVGNVGARTSHPAVTEHDEKLIESTFNEILRKGPIIIFSKSYCPYSKKAKHILLDLYSITPPPYVVELDQHELGPGLQGLLGTLTGRTTVPNILINGKSIGGGDDVQQLHLDNKLASTISSMGGKRMTKVQRLEDDVKVEMKFKA